MQPTLDRLGEETPENSHQRLEQPPKDRPHHLSGVLRFSQRNAGPLTVVLAAVVSIFLVKWTAVGDFGHMLRPMRMMLAGKFSDVYPVDTAGTSLTGWLAIAAGPFVAARAIYGEVWGWAIASLVAVPLLVGGVRYAARAIYPEMSVTRAWGLAALSLMLPTTLSNWFEYYHPQDIAALGVMLVALGLIARRHWTWAGAVFGLAILTRHWVVLVALVVAPLIGPLREKAVWKFGLTLVGVVIVGVAPIVLLGNEGLMDAVSAKMAQITDQTVTGRLLNYLSGDLAPGDTLASRLLRTAPVALSGLLALFVWRKGWRDPAYIVPLAVLAIGFRFLLETAPYTYYWAPVCVLFLLVVPNWRAVAMGVGLSFLVWPFRSVGGMESIGGYGPFLTSVLFLLTTMGFMYLTWTLLTDAEDEGSKGEGSKSENSGSEPPATVSPPPADRRARRSSWVIGSVASALILLGSGVYLQQTFNPLAGPNGISLSREIGNVNVAPVEVVGEPLAPLFPGLDAPDPSIGDLAPGFIGVSIENRDLNLKPGIERLYVVLSHWCELCIETPEKVELYRSSTFRQPNNKEVVIVISDEDSSKGNWPPGPWIYSQGYQGMVLMDNEKLSAATALGMVGFEQPLFILTDDQGRVTDRWYGDWDRDRVRAND